MQFESHLITDGHGDVFEYICDGAPCWMGDKSRIAESWTLFNKKNLVDLLKI